MYTNESNALQQSINLLHRAVNILDSQRGEDEEKQKTPLQEDIEVFILKLSKPQETFYDSDSLH